jgi:hypothetical protein
MKFFAEFYKQSTGYVEGSIPPRFDPAHVKPIPALGSDGVGPLDGRMGLARLKSEAERQARQRGRIGFVIHRGSSYRDSRPITAFIPVSGSLTPSP